MEQTVNNKNIINSYVTSLIDIFIKVIKLSYFSENSYQNRPCIQNV